MLTVATYFWTDPKWPQEIQYNVKDVVTLKDRVNEHLTVPHNFMVITDQMEKFYEIPDIIPAPLDKSIHVPGTAFAKLLTFSPHAKYFLGERVFVMDLDSLPVANFDEVVARKEDLVLWRNPTRLPWNKPKKTGRPYYNTSFVLHTPGSFPELYTGFDPENPMARDDQWLVSRLVGPECPYWDSADGLYRIARSDTPGSGIWGMKPKNAKIITFCGSEGKPNNPKVRRANPWIAQYYN